MAFRRDVLYFAGLICHFRGGNVDVYLAFGVIEVWFFEVFFIGEGLIQIVFCWLLFGVDGLVVWLEHCDWSGC